MSAIDTTFHFVRNPTAINGLATTYVSKRGSDVSGDGTAQNPYASIAKATSVATAGTNIMIDDGEWDEARTLNSRVFKWWGNAKVFYRLSVFYNREEFHYITFPYFDNSSATHSADISTYPIFNNCFIYRIKERTYQSGRIFNNCIIANYKYDNISGWDYGDTYINNSIVFNAKSPTARSIYATNSILNIVGGTTNIICKNCNVLDGTISADMVNCINNATTGQTLADYFNYVHPNVVANPLTASIDEWLLCDFTAKEGSANIGAGEKGTTIGLNQGYTMYADNSTNDMFSPSNGATLKNIAWDSTLNGYTLVQKERVCQGATSTTITLDSSASAVDDYYNNLFVGIVGESFLGGGGYGEFYRIIDYDGATKTATIDGTWNEIPNTESVYTISGTILSAVKDFGKAIKVKRNWTFADNFTALTDGQWAEFMTHVEANGKQFPVSCYSYEYSTDGVNFVQGQTADDLVSAINGENKVTDNIYGDCSPNYNEANAKNLVMRYIRVRIHIGFNIGQLGE